MTSKKYTLVLVSIGIIGNGLSFIINNRPLFMANIMIIIILIFQQIVKRFNKKVGMAQIRINNQNYTGDNIIIDNNKIVIDNVVTQINDKIINISIVGNVDSLRVASCETLTVNGDIKTLDSTSGNIKCNNITGNVECISGNITTKSIGGNVKTISGNIIKKI